MYIDINDIKLHYKCFGEGEEVILIPGNGTSIKYMIKLAKLLATKYKVYLLDRRGQGKSTKKCKITYELNVQDVYDFIQKLNIQRPYLIGHSGGAIISMMFCLEHEAIVRKLVLCSGAPNLKSVDSKCIKNWNLLGRLRIINPKILDMMLNEPDITDRLQEIKTEVLVLAGQKDIIKPEGTKAIINNIKNSKYRIYENENHSSYIINTRCFEDILKFFNEE